MQIIVDEDMVNIYFVSKYFKGKKICICFYHKINSLIVCLFIRYITPYFYVFFVLLGKRAISPRVAKISECPFKEWNM